MCLLTKLSIGGIIIVAFLSALIIKRIKKTTFKRDTELLKNVISSLRISKALFESDSSNMKLHKILMC